MSHVIIITFQLLQRGLGSTMDQNRMETTQNQLINIIFLILLIRWNSNGTYRQKLKIILF